MFESPHLFPTDVELFTFSRRRPPFPSPCRRSELKGKRKIGRGVFSEVVRTPLSSSSRTPFFSESPHGRVKT